MLFSKKLQRLEIHKLWPSQLKRTASERTFHISNKLSPPLRNTLIFHKKGFPGNVYGKEQSCLYNELVTLAK